MAKGLTPMASPTPARTGMKAAATTALVVSSVMMAVTMPTRITIRTEFMPSRPDSMAAIHSATPASRKALPMTMEPPSRMTAFQGMSLKPVFQSQTYSPFLKSMGQIMTMMAPNMAMVSSVAKGNQSPQRMERVHHRTTQIMKMMAVYFSPLFMGPSSSYCLRAMEMSMSGILSTLKNFTM